MQFSKWTLRLSVKTIQVYVNYTVSSFRFVVMYYNSAEFEHLLGKLYLL